MQLVAPFVGGQHMGHAVQGVAGASDAVAEAADQDVEAVVVGGVGGQIGQCQHQRHAALRGGQFQRVQDAAVGEHFRFQVAIATQAQRMHLDTVRQGSEHSLHEDTRR